MMHDKLKKAFDSVTAEEALRSKTYDSVSEFIRNRSVPMGTDDFIGTTSASLADSSLNWKKSHRRRRRIFTFAASVLLCIGIFSVGGYRYYFSETSYISIDLNPSIELSLNPLDRVIDAKAYNEDGERILRTADTMYKNYEDALTLLLAEEANAHYMKKDSYLLITLQTSEAEKKEIMLDDLETIVSHCVKNKHPSVETEIASTDEKTRQAAHHQKLSTGKYMAIQALQTTNPEITFEDCAHLSMQEIRSMYGAEHSAGGECRPGRDGISKSAGEGKGNGGKGHRQENCEEN